MLLDRHIIFRPKRLPQNHVFQSEYPITEYFLNLEVESNTFNINMVHLKSEQPKGWVFFLHGTLNHIQYHLPKANTFLEQQYDVVMMDYPKYGKSNGVLIESLLYRVVEQVYYSAKDIVKSDKKAIIAGRSLGTALASNLATKVAAEKVILISPFYSMPDLFKHKVKLFSFKNLKFKLENYAHIPKILGDTYILHGTADKLIPIELAQKLKPYLKSSKHFVIIDGANHFDIHEKEKFKHVIAEILK